MPRTPALASTLLLAAVGLLAGPAPAQRPSSWVLAPAPAVPANAVQHLGKILWFVEGGNLHAFSAATRRWQSFPVGPNATIRSTNDWLLVSDGPIVAAMSSARGLFDVLPVSPQAFVVNPSNARNDGIALVLDGQTLWTFSGFVGRWTSRTLALTAQVAVQRNVALVTEGAQVFAQSALFGAWMPLTATFPISAVGAGDTAGWATDGLEAFGFSAIRNEWDRAALPAGAAPQPQVTRDVAVWPGSSALLAFSGVRGAFDLVGIPVPVPVTLADHLAHAASPSGTTHWLFSAAEARWTTVTTNQPAAAQLAEATALLVEPGLVHGYSALNSSVAPLTVTNPQFALNAAVAAVVDGQGRQLDLFSAITGSWARAPAAALVNLPPLSRNGALLRDVAGTTAWAFSARSGRFVARALGASPQLQVDGGSALLAVEDDGHLAVFEPRREVWLDAPITAADRPLALRIWRTTLVACTSTEALGFSPMHGTIERIALPGSLIEPRASSEVGAAITAAGVLAFSAVSDLRTESQFPEFRRMFGRGSRVDLEATGSAGALVGAVGGFARGPATAVPGLGELVLDPQGLIPVTALTLDADGVATLRLPVPDLAALAGIELAFQAVLVPNGGTPYLSRACSFRIH
jgi:hypothetical protein